MDGIGGILMSQTTFLLNSGHGSDTAGKRSPYIPPGVREWEFNLSVVKEILRYAPFFGRLLEVVHLDPEMEAVPLSEICRRANERYEQNHNCILISVHANAIGDGKDWNLNAKGSTVLISPRASETSRVFGKMLSENIASFGKFSNRGVKKRHLYVLNKTKCPAVLSENGFMTHPDDACKLASHYWRKQIALAHITSMIEWTRRCEKA
jgi:N-acetylmuramoyl-L-alanine amidase